MLHTLPSLPATRPTPAGQHSPHESDSGTRIRIENVQPFHNPEARNRAGRQPNTIMATKPIQRRHNIFPPWVPLAAQIEHSGNPDILVSCFWILFLRGCSPDNTRAPWCLSGLEISNYIWPKSKPLATKVLLRTHKRPECILPTHDRDLSSNPPIHQSIFQDGTRKKGSNFMIPLNTKERKYW